jgi:hypothetical protein
MFNFNWFGSESRKKLKERIAELEKENLILKTTKSVLQQVNDVVNEVLEEKRASPYKSLRIVGSSVIVVLQDGTCIPGDISLYDKIKQAKTEQEVLELFKVPDEAIKSTTPIPETKEEKQLIRDNWEVLRDHEDFEIKNNEAYVKGISLPLPAVIAASFIEILEKIEAIDFGAGNVETQGLSSLEEQYQALRMFWLKLAVNPLENSRNQLLTFVKKNDVRITATGNLVLYRKIVKLGEENSDLVEFVSQQYTKIKKWKKSPKNYIVVEETETIKEEVPNTGQWEDNPEYNQDDADEADDNDEDYDVPESIWVDGGTTTKVRTKQVLKLRHVDDVINGEDRGNLEKLYLDLPNMSGNTYTSYHNKGRYVIKVGEVYKEDASMLNTDAGLCAAGGLHAAAVDYDYSGFGDTPVVVLVNPSKALTVPTHETGKLRTTEMFIVCVNDKPLGQHFDDVMLYDEQYNQHTIEELENAIATKDFSSLNIEDKKTKVNEDDLSVIAAALRGRIVTV